MLENNKKAELTALRDQATEAYMRRKEGETLNKYSKSAQLAHISKPVLLGLQPTSQVCQMASHLPLAPWPRHRG